MAAKSGSGKLKKGAATGRDNLVRVKPFSILDSEPEPADGWDPPEKGLALAYRINDPHERIRAGRILYLVRGPKDWLVVHRQSLKSPQFSHGRCEIPSRERWDGSITEGRIVRGGQELRRVTADLSKVRIVIQVWNIPSAAPGELPRDKWEGRTNVAGEWVSSAVAHAGILGVAKCEWDREWVIPYGDPVEPDKGIARLKIRVKNIWEGAPVRFEIDRIGSVDKPDSDSPYVDTNNSDRETQPGLHGATVRNGQVLLQDGSTPFVRFDRYEEHWKEPGNNFYVCRVAFGDGDMMVASERNYQTAEKGCLHMKFTVFICVDPREPYPLQGGKDLHAFFGKTRYYRSYLMEDPKDADDWLRHFAHRYIVVLIQHGASGCLAPEHPRDPKTREPKHIPERDFPPDTYACPKTLPAGYAAAEYGACGSTNGVYQRMYLGKLRHPGDKGQDHAPQIRLRCDCLPATAGPGHLRLFTQEFTFERKSDDKGKPKWEVKHGKILWQKDCDLRENLPRLLFWGGSCQSILSRSFGQRVVQGGTRYYHGWIYTVRKDYAASLPLRFFRRWIQGLDGEKPPSEFDLARFVGVYRAEMRRMPETERHPRLMDEAGILDASLNEKQKALANLYGDPELPPEPIPSVH